MNKFALQWTSILKEIEKNIDSYTSGQQSIYWAAHQRFFQNLCIASKVEKAVQLAQKGVEDGYSVVFGIQSTGEARLNEFSKKSLQNESFSSLR